MHQARYIIRLLFVAIAASCSYRGKTQNLLPNGNFEEVVMCPITHSLIDWCKNWRNYTTLGSPDFFHKCGSYSFPKNSFGYTFPASGDGFAGIYTYWPRRDIREYMAIETPPLILGGHYEVSMSVSLSDFAGIGTDNLGVFFFENGAYTINTDLVLPVSPQISFSSYGPLTDTANWTRLTGTFIADSAYRTMVVGSFGKSSDIKKVAVLTGDLTYYGYYYIDSVLLRLIRVKPDFTDSAICVGDTIINVPFTVLPTSNFNPGNIFTLQLSDAFGSFNNPLIIGSIASVTSGAIQGIIPPNLSFGTRYRLRIVSSNPVDYSPDNGFDVVLNFEVAASSNSPVCEKDTLRLTATELLQGIQYNWSGPAFSSAEKSPVINRVNAGGDYVVEATYRDCRFRDTVNVIVKPLPLITVSSNNPACVDDTIKLRIETTASNPTFNWTGKDFHSTEQYPVIAPVKKEHAGIYAATATADGCTSPKSDINVDVLSKPMLDLGEDQFICANQKIIIGAEYPNSIHAWNTGSKECCIPISEQGLYTESITNACGTASDDINILAISCDSCLFIPSAFTPNGDGRNDLFGVVLRCSLEKYSLKVFNRWGQVVFQGDDVSQKWDGMYKGSPADVGNYFYLVEYAPNKQKMQLKGNVTLIR